ncbi:hypothetical protein GJ744_004702 [Endocarpon pusillum]|uniref:Uncharacterized protein n=1 Tax=Endocarpon pusillum TaxID=364733 RepID=A0A8H7A9H7_9EURO|nr:hypothetical protein GJ744_004702 [Endocarpon pusillum]
MLNMSSSVQVGGLGSTGLLQCLGLTCDLSSQISISSPPASFLSVSSQHRGVWSQCLRMSTTNTTSQCNQESL